MAVADETLREWARTDLDDLRHDLEDLIILAKRFSTLRGEKKVATRTQIQRLGYEIRRQAAEAEPRLFLYIDRLPRGAWTDEVASDISYVDHATMDDDAESINRAVELLHVQIEVVEYAQRQICGAEFQQSSVLEPIPSEAAIPTTAEHRNEMDSMPTTSPTAAKTS